MKFIPGKTRIQYGGAMLGLEEVKVVMDVMLSNNGTRWTVGPESIAFEKELAETTGVNHAVVVNSGSSALLVAIAALKLPKGSKIIIPACNFPTAFNAIIQNGHIPVVVDVDLNTFNIDLNEVIKAITQYPDIRAVIAVDIAGNPVNLVELREIVGRKVKIILDDCDGYGTTLGGKFIETYADVSCVSFHAAHIITTGEGGAVMTDDDEIAARATKLREWGRASGTDTIYSYPGFPLDYKERYVYEEIGWNMKPLELQCALGRVQLKRLQEFKDARRKNFSRLCNVFVPLGLFETIDYIDESDPCWFSFPLLVKKDRGRIMQTLEENNIECRTVFSGNILRHPAYKDIEVIQIGDLKNSDTVMSRGMFLSCHPSLTREMISFIGEVAAKC